jgi:hypothetical protein
MAGAVPTVTLDPALAWLLCVAGGLVFLWGALAKWRERELFAAAMENYELIPAVAVPTASLALILAEGLIGLLLFLPGLRPWPQFAGVALLLVVTCAVAINLLRGRDHISCGCGGVSGEQTLSWGLVIRNLLFAAVLGVAASSAGSRALGSVDHLVIVLGAALLVGIYAAASQLIANSPRLQALRNGT